MQSWEQAVRRPGRRPEGWGVRGLHQSQPLAVFSNQQESSHAAEYVEKLRSEFPNSCK